MPDDCSPESGCLSLNLRDACVRVIHACPDYRLPGSGDQGQFAPFPKVKRSGRDSSATPDMARCDLDHIGPADDGPFRANTRQGLILEVARSAETHKLEKGTAPQNGALLAGSNEAEVRQRTPQANESTSARTSGLTQYTSGGSRLSPASLPPEVMRQPLRLHVSGHAWAASHDVPSFRHAWLGPPVSTSRPSAPSAHPRSFARLPV
jgi:hypothetical protein